MIGEQPRWHHAAAGDRQQHIVGIVTTACQLRDHRFELLPVKILFLNLRHCRASFRLTSSSHSSITLRKTPLQTSSPSTNPTKVGSPMHGLPTFVGPTLWA